MNAYVFFLFVCFFQLVMLTHIWHRDILSNNFLHSMDPKSQNNWTMMPCFHIPSCDGSALESRRPYPVRSTLFVCSRFFAWAHPIPQKPCFSRGFMLFIQLQLYNQFHRYLICKILLFDYHIQKLQLGLFTST